MSTNFNTLNSITKKQRMLFLGDSLTGVFAPIAYSTSANLSFSSDDVDVSNKMDGNWTTSMQGKKSAELSVDALVAYKDSLTNEVKLQQGWKSDKLYYFLYIMVEVVASSDGLTSTLKYDTSVPYYVGRMKLSSLELSSDNGDVCKFSCSGNSQGTVAEHTEIMWKVEQLDASYISFNVYKPGGGKVGELMPLAPADELEACDITISDTLKSEFEATFSNGKIIIEASVTIANGEKVTITFDDITESIVYIANCNSVNNDAIELPGGGNVAPSEAEEA